jgi:hypothetical protein
MTTAISERPIPTGEGLTFEKVWAMFQESRLQMNEDRLYLKETDRIVQENALQLKELDRIIQENALQMKETDRKFKETDRKFKETALQMKETDRKFKETDRKFKETALQMKETDRKMGDLYNRFGEMAEHLVAPGIAQRFNERGFHFDSIMPGGIKIVDEQRKVIAEIDLLLENGEYIIAIEVKATVRLKDVEHHIRRLDILREHRAKKHERPKKIQGAIAGAIFGAAEKQAVIEAGFYALEQSGDTMKMVIPADFVPREW